MYKKGDNRLFYQSPSDHQQDVTIEIITPSLEHKGPFEMTYFENGLYYIDVVFTTEGSHVFYVCEEGVKKHRDILTVQEGGFIIYPSGDII